MNVTLIQQQIQNMEQMTENLDKILSEALDGESGAAVRIIRAIRVRVQDMKDRLYEIKVELSNVTPTQGGGQ